MSFKLNRYVIWFNDGNNGYKDTFVHQYHLEDFAQEVLMKTHIISESKIVYTTKYISTIRKLND